MEYLPLFVYGTLKKGYGNYNRYLMGKVVNCVPGTVKGQMLDIGAFPAMICGEGVVHGELVYINRKYYTNTIKDCDALEGYNPNSDFNMYDRKVVEVTTSDGDTVSAWGYIWAYSSLKYPIIEDGNWSKHFRAFKY